jgi:hypothetical protein
MPEPSKDAWSWLEIDSRVRTAAGLGGIESLKPLERTVHCASNFNCEEENGGLSQFFYNTDCSPSFAEATASALVDIGAPKTAEVLREAARLFTHPPDGTLGSTWGQYLAAVDPDKRLRDFERRLPIAGEDIFSLLEAFVLQHRNELESSN